MNRKRGWALVPPLFFMEKRVKFSKISGIVLGGGESRRMGRDKRRLQWEGEPFLDRVSRVMDTLFEEVLVVTAQEDYDCSHLPVRLVTDKIPQKGSLGGLYTGLLEAKNSLVFVVACDMPFLQRECISRFCVFSGTADVLVVKLSSGIQPLHARYSKRCAPIIEQMIQKEDLKIQNLVTHSDLAVEIMGESLFDDIDPYRRSFMNVNTPADLEFARKTSSHPSLP